MNDVSSRSHAIFTIFIDSEPIKNEKLDNVMEFNCNDDYIFQN